MANFGFKLVQQKPEGAVMSIKQDENSEQKITLSSWQEYFSTQFSNLFRRVGKIENYTLQAGFLRIEHLQEKVDTNEARVHRKIGRDKHFVSHIVTTVEWMGRLN